MTWMLRQLNREEAAAETPAQPVPVPTTIDLFMAGRKDYHITEDAWAQSERQRAAVLDELIEGAGGYQNLTPQTPEDWRRWSNPKTAPDYILERAQEAIARDPGAWGDRPRTREEFDAAVIAARKAELDEARAVLGASDSVVAPFIGQLTGAVTDPVALPTWLLGGPLGRGAVGAAKFIGREAAIGAGVEVATTPRAQEVSEDLGLPDQDMAARVALGAAAGAGFAGVIAGGARGVEYLRTRRQAEGEARPADMDGAEFQARVDRAEQDLRAGTDTGVGGMATQQGAVDTSQSFVLGVAGASGNQSAMIRLPDGTVMTNVRVGDDLADGSKVVAIADDQITITRDGQTIAAKVGQSIAAPNAEAPAPAPAVAFTSVADAGQGFTVVVGPDGQAVRREGTRAWRNNNPGNIEFGNFARSHGAIGTDGRFAVFPTYEQGRRAKESLLWETGSYRGLTIDQAINRYAPPVENNTAAYVNAVARAVGVPANTPMSALTPAQRSTMLDAMEAVEGFKPGRENGVQVAGSGRATAAMNAGGARNFDLGTSRTMTRYDEVSTPAGTRVPVEYQVVDLGDLTPARGEFQPRDRSRSSSDEQVAEIAARLDAVRLMPNPEADRGAPIVGPDMMVESGNGRVMALRRAADEHPDRYAAYLDAVRAAGFDVPEGMKRPALVAVRRGDMTLEQRRAFVTEANDSGTMRMAASEQGGRDADFLTQAVFDAYQPGQPVAQQAPFLRALLSQMPQSERAAMYSADGRLSADGLRRVRQALFARAYNAPDLLRLLAESPDPRTRAMLDMLDDLAPDWAAFRAMVEGGMVKPAFDVTDPMLDMVRTIAKARTEGRDGQSVISAIRDQMAQADMFADGADDALSNALLRTFYKGDLARRPSDAGDILRRYIADAQIAGRADADDLFGPVAPADVLDTAIRNHEAKAPTAPARAAAPSVPDTRGMNPAPMLDGAASPVLIQQAKETQAALQQALTPPDDVSQLLLVARERLEIRAHKIERLTQADGPVRLELAGTDQRALVSRAPDQEGGWRVTYLDQSGPVGHSDFDTKANALRRAFEENFEEVQPARAPATEATAAGEQVLIPGVEPITQRQRLEAEMAAPATGRDVGAGSGRDDLFGNPDDRRDLFDASQRAADGPSGQSAPTPAGTPDMAPSAAAAQDFAALRDLTIRLDENGPEIRVSDMLDDLTANEDLAALVSICTKKG